VPPRPVIRVAVRPAAIVLAIAAVGVAHYSTDPAHYVLHNVYQRLYYVPILLAAIWYGLKGGTLAAFGCTASYVPHIALQWQHHQAYQVSQLAEMAMFFVVGALAGILADRERVLRRRAETSAEERDRALRDLEGTVETLRRADRLATLGMLAAGMAHEIRNPLAALAGAVEIVARDYPVGHSRREFVDILRREVGRLNTTVTKYLDFARPQPPELRPLDVDEAVRVAIELVAKSAQRAHVEIRAAPPETVRLALADPVLLHQVLVNLLVNGIQAMPSGGRLDVACRRDHDRVEIAVRDHGAGLPPEGRERIFEPFFTTRPGGTGLGLAVSRQIAEAHAGTLTADDAEGGGAVFRLTLRTAPAG
jgi:two-component system, NtrC family, sensor histidine kinase HydH